MSIRVLGLALLLMLGGDTLAVVYGIDTTPHDIGFSTPKFSYFTEKVKEFIDHIKDECGKLGDLQKREVSQECLDLIAAREKLGRIEFAELYWVEFNVDIKDEGLKEILFKVAITEPQGAIAYFMFPTKAEVSRELPLIGKIREIIIKRAPLTLKLDPLTIVQYRITAFGAKKPLFGWMLSAGAWQDLQRGPQRLEVLVEIPKGEPVIKGTITVCESERSRCQHEPITKSFSYKRAL